MFTTTKKMFRCNVCGRHSEHDIIVNSSAGENSDLDLRPEEPHRSSMGYWTMTCESCGYCNGTIEDYADVKKSFFKSEKYLNLDGFITESDLAKSFIKKALVNIESDDLDVAMQSYVYCAWVFDDNEELENAIESRKRAVNLIDTINSEKMNYNYLILKADLLRRAGLFEDVISTFSAVRFENKPDFNAILQFHIEKSKESDNKVYTFKDVQEFLAK